MFAWIADRATPRRRVERGEVLTADAVQHAREVRRQTDAITERKARARALEIYIDSIGPRRDR